MPAGPSAEAMSGETLKRLRFYLAVLEISIFIYTFMPAGPSAEALSGETLKRLRFLAFLEISIFHLHVHAGRAFCGSPVRRIIERT
jgi:hypothetical protein